MSEFLKDLKRTHDCGSLRGTDVGSSVVLFGWVSSRRDHGGCVFIDLRDRAGVTQIVFEPQTSAQAHTLASELRSEFCIGLQGVVRDRGERRNPNLVRGDIYSGDCELSQSYLWRPLPGYGSHRTPIAQLWHCGASTYPGPGLNAASGRIVGLAAALPLDRRERALARLRRAR